MESLDVNSKINTRRLANMRSLAARYPQQGDLADALKWTPSYLSQLIGPRPSRPISERTARSVERKLGLAEGILDGEPPPPPAFISGAEPAGAPSSDLIERTMLAIDETLRSMNAKIGEAQYRALVSHQVQIAAKTGNVDREGIASVVRILLK